MNKKDKACNSREITSGQIQAKLQIVIYEC